MQTFLPYPSFARSTRVLDTPRLGKQRVETLQILRALLVPTYGWQGHPAVGMWRGFVPALTAYGLAAVEAWTGRGHADTVRGQLVEFAPQVVGRTQAQLADDGLLPPWVGDAALHQSHRSRLIAKDPEFYGPLFPGTPPDIEYVWPEVAVRQPPPSPHGLWVVRTASVDPACGVALLGLPATDARGRVTPAWWEQVRAVEDELTPELQVGVLADDRPDLVHLARVALPAASAVVDGTPYTAVVARLEGTVLRAALPVPALLQNPRRVFRIELPVPLGGTEDFPG